MGLGLHDDDEGQDGSKDGNGYRHGESEDGLGEGREREAGKFVPSRTSSRGLGFGAYKSWRSATVTSRLAPPFSPFLFPLLTWLVRASLVSFHPSSRSKYRRYMKGLASSATKSANVTSAPDRPEDQHAQEPMRQEPWWNSCIQSYLKREEGREEGKEGWDRESDDAGHISKRQQSMRGQTLKSYRKTGGAQQSPAPPFTPIPTLISSPPTPSLLCLLTWQ